MFQVKILQFRIMNLDRKFFELYDSVVKTAYTTIFFSANQKEEPKISKKTSINFCVWKKYYSVPQFFCPMPITRKGDDRFHPIQHMYLTWRFRDVRRSLYMYFLHVVGRFNVFPNFQLNPRFCYSLKYVLKAIWKLSSCVFQINLSSFF